MDIARLTDPARVAAVRALAILDTPPEPEFDDLAQIAAAIFRAPGAAVTVVDADRGFVKAIVGAVEHPVAGVPLHRSPEAATLAVGDGTLVVPDVAADPRWAASGSRACAGFYAGAAVRHRGQPVAVICAYGPDPRTPSSREVAALAALGRQVGRHLELRRRGEEWREVAGTDPLTGLANRRRLRQAMEVALAERRMGEDRVGVLFCDIDAFKAVNDQFGHEAGDRLLCEVAGRLREAVRDTDVVARIAGDEFVVLCPRLSGTPALRLTARRVRGICREPFPAPVGTLRLSVGAVLARAGETADDVLRRADAVMYADKSAHRPAAISSGSPRA